MEVLEGGAATLRCVLSSVAMPVEWRCGDELLRPGGKYSMRQEGTRLELVVRDLRPQDSGQYACCYGDQMTSATLTVKGKSAPPARAASYGPSPCAWEDEDDVLISDPPQHCLLSS